MSDAGRIGPDALERRRLRVDGIVQGVGFRPFVHGLARGLDLAGEVANDASGVVIEVEGPPSALDAFGDRLPEEAPALARIEGISAVRIPARGERGFAIVESRVGGAKRALVAADVATCDACLAEIFDPADRRYRYPFTNCTACGPRFTIVRDVPYDRARTTMCGFALCEDCEREYRDPADRRFHAEPVCCPACGPRLALLRPGSPDGAERDGDPLSITADALRAGEVVAIKGIGGFHLAALAADEAAVSRLRSRKHREEKPFAVMVPDLESARRVAIVDEAEARALTDRRRPIVLLTKAPGSTLPAGVAPENRSVGVFLPYSPLHHLLLGELGEPIVLTSGNVSDEPIAYEDEDAVARLSTIADLFLVHDRPIHVRADDSVIRVVRGRQLPIRRSRGFAPEPLALPVEAPEPILACGGELKSAFCLTSGRTAFLSHHLGDLENLATFDAYREGIRHFERLFAIRPRVVAHDLHPEYLSTKQALEIAGVERIAVQHHHAHVAACLADAGDVGPAIGFAFDGLGLGDDGTLWGGEVLVADLVGFERVAHLETVAMPGGGAAIREPWRMALAWLDAAYDGRPPAGLGVLARNGSRLAAVRSLVASRTNAPATSSMGRLFDAVAAILGVRDRVTYEGQAAILLEQLADPEEQGGYPARIDDGPPARIRGADWIRAVVEDLDRGVARSRVAARFHEGVVDALVRLAERSRRSRGLDTVALSGGVFQNRRLLARAIAALERGGFRVLRHERVPPNDGGLAFGQAAVAAATLQRRGGS